MPRVLIVDDFPDAAEATEMLLTMRGLTCAVAVTGTQALALAESFRPDLAILDIGLPDLSGYEVARGLRARADGRHLYIAAVTGWNDAETRVRALEAGFDKHVTKPTDRKKIEEILEAAERAHHASRSD
jgi:DNA-binding response OmpR family regulator